jgi:hypothetical protein
MVRAGMPLELVARQLGHRDVVMVGKVYGRFVPTSQERDRWETIAAALDEEKWAGRGVSGSASNEKALEPERPSACEDDSRGGTRTHDPGIMRIVA